MGLIFGLSCARVFLLAIIALVGFIRFSLAGGRLSLVIQDARGEVVGGHGHLFSLVVVLSVVVIMFVGRWLWGRGAADEPVLVRLV